MHTSTGDIRQWEKIPPDEREKTKPDGTPLWVPFTRENLHLVDNGPARARALKAIEKRERRAARNRHLGDPR